MSNVAFVLRQQMTITKRLTAERNPVEEELKANEQALSAAIAYVSKVAANSTVIAKHMELFDLGDLGKVAGILLYSGHPGSRFHTVRIVLVPDIGCLATAQSEWDGSTDAIPDLGLRTVQDAMNDEFYSHPNLMVDVLGKLLELRQLHDQQVAFPSLTNSC